MTLISYFTQEIQKSIDTKQRYLSDAAQLKILETVTELTIKAYRDGKKTLFAGNGGSAADSQHLAAEFVSRFYYDRPGLPSHALTVDTSILTAIGNDYSFENLFARQIETIGVKGDIFFAISTSGNSPNILKAIAAAKEKGLIVVGLTGSADGKMDAMCDYTIKVPSPETPRIQECHILIGHLICASVEKAIFPR